MPYCDRDKFTREELLGTDTDGWYTVDDGIHYECENCGEDLPTESDYLDEVLFYRIPGQEECYCVKCFPQVLKSKEFLKECEVTEV